MFSIPMKQLPLVPDPNNPGGAADPAGSTERSVASGGSRFAPLRRPLDGAQGAVVTAAMARGRSLDPLFGHLRLSHPAHGELPDERITRVARELAWTVPHVAVLGPTELRFRVPKAGDARHALDLARTIASKCGATRVRAVVATSPLAAALALKTPVGSSTTARSGEVSDDVLHDEVLGHAESLVQLARSPVDTLLLSTGARILLAAARVRTLLDLASATALPALDEIERIRVPAARALGLVAIPAASGVASISSSRGDDRAAQWAWMATPLLRHAASSRRRSKSATLVVQLRVRLLSGAQVSFALSAPPGSLRSQTDILALAAGHALREADLASPMVAAEAHVV